MSRNKKQRDKLTQDELDKLKDFSEKDKAIRETISYLAIQKASALREYLNVSDNFASFDKRLKERYGKDARFNMEDGSVIRQGKDVNEMKVVTDEEL